MPSSKHLMFEWIIVGSVESVFGNALGAMRTQRWVVQWTLIDQSDERLHESSRKIKREDRF